jgi:alpha-glucoside transport system substrate-binding protein
MRVLKAVPVVAAVALVLAGCGGGTTPAGAGAGTGGAKLDGQTVEIAAIWSGDEQEKFKAVLDAFEKKTGAKVTYTSAGDELPTVLATRLAGGSPPDIAVVGQPGLVKTLAKAGSLKPLSAATNKVVDEQFAPVWKKLGTVDGKLYGLVFKAANKSTVWYNAKTLGSSFTPPKTWDAFVDTLRTRSDTGSAPLSVGGADGWTLTDWFENVYLQTAGGDMYDKLANHEIPWTDPSVKTALTTLGRAFQGQFMPSGAASALQTEFTASVVNVFGPNPRASIVYEGDFVESVITKSTSAQVGKDAKFFPFPTVANTPAVVTGGDTVVALTDKPATAALTEFLASAEAATVWAKQGGFLSPNKNVAAADYPNDIARSLATEVVNTQNVRFDMSDLMPTVLGGTKGDGFWKAMQEFLADPTKVDAILANLETKATAAYKGL